MGSKRSVLVIIVTLVVVSLQAQDLSVALEAGSVERAGAPRFVGDRILFTYSFGADRDDGRVNSVQIAFAKDNFGELIPFARNEKDVYVLLYAPPPGVTDLRYRLIVNGIWTTDPMNLDLVEDRWGVQLSRLVLPVERRRTIATPIVHDDGEVDFIVNAAPGSHVSLVGSFNGWDPYMTPMYETSPGVFARKLRLGSGEYLYYYVVNGLRMPDPGNDERKWHVSGRAVSVVSLP